jgi:hypothetical protein
MVTGLQRWCPCFKHSTLYMRHGIGISYSLIDGCVHYVEPAAPIFTTGKHFYSMILNVVCIVFCIELHSGVLSLKAVMTKRFRHEGHANRILSSVVTPFSPVSVYQHFKGTCWPSNLPWWRRQKVEYYESSLHVCRIRRRFLSEVSNVVTNCAS